MGLELYITRAEDWSDNKNAAITAEEWMAYVATDPELQPRPENGPYFVQWSGPSKNEEPWLDWFQGNISSKWPDSALYQKMLRIAKALGAQVQDDDGTVYSKAADWSYDPDTPIPPLAPARKSWWQRLLGK